MNKKILLCVLVVLTAAFLTAAFVGCDDSGDTKYVLSIDNIFGVSDAVVDNEAKTVAFRVQNSIDAFPLSSIRFTDGETIVYEAYEDEELTRKYEGDNVPLVEGDNVFWVKGWFALATDKYAVYKFTVTRTRSEQSVKSIATDAETWKSEFFVNEVLPQCYVIVTYEDDSTEKVLVTADMVSGFDTSTPGTKEITITYKGFEFVTSIEVVEVGSVELSVTLGAWQSAYFVGEEIYLDGAYLLCDDGEKVYKIAISENMVSGFDTSEAGTVSVTVTYAGKTVQTEINVYALFDEEYDEVQRSTLDVDRFEANINKIFKAFGVDIYSWSDHDRTMLVSIFEYLGLTDDDVESVVGMITADGVTLLDDLIKIISGQAESGFTFIMTDENVGTLADVLAALKDKISAKQLVRAVSLLVKVSYGNMDSVVTDDSTEWEYSVNFKFDFDRMWATVSAEEIAKFIENGDPDSIAVFEEYTSKEATEGYSQSGDIEKVLSMDETAYVAGAILDSIAAACNYDREKICDMVALAKKVVDAVLAGDINELLGGNAEGLSYKAMVAQINELGKLLETLNQTFADDPLLVRCGAAVIDGILDIWSDTMVVAFDGNTILNAVLALEKVAIGCMTKADANLVAGIYLDYDDYAKASEETAKETKLGYLVAKIAAFAYPEYQKLELKEKAALDNATEMLALIGIDINLRGFVDLMEKAAAKDVDDFTEEELRAIADEWNRLLGGEKTETEDRLTVMPYGTVLVEVGSTKEELAQAIASTAQIVFYDASLGVSLVIEDLDAYTINFDASKEGFFDAEIVIEGAKNTVGCYAYDSTTPSKFVLYKERHELSGYVFEKGEKAEMENGTTKLSYKHVETGRIISVTATIDGFVSDVDTSGAGYSLATAGYTSYVFGKVELPVLITVLDLSNVSADMVSRVMYTYCDILPQGSDIIIEADIVIAYVIFGHVNIIVSGLDNSTLGETEFTATFDQNDFGLEYSEQLKVTVVTKEEAMTVTNAYVGVDERENVYSVGTTSDQIYATYNISYKYYPASSGSQGDVAYLNEAYLAKQGLKIKLEGFDADTASDVNVPRTGRILLVSLADESVVFAESEFGYYVYDPEVQPPVVIGTEDNQIWDMYLSGNVYTESEVATLNAFIGRSYEIVTKYGGDFSLVMSDGSVGLLSDFVNADMTDRGSVVLSNMSDRGQWKEYSVSFNIDYLYVTVGNIKVIPDAYKNLPTSLSVNYAKDTVLLDEQLTVESVLGTVTFGYGYFSKQISGEEEKDMLTISYDTSSAGNKKYTVTYTLSGVAIKATAHINVISLKEALSNNISDGSYTSYTLSSDNATEDALLGKQRVGYRLYMGYSVNQSDLTMKTANEYWESNGINVWFAVKNADGEYNAFDGSVGTLRGCTLLVCAEYYGNYAEVELYDVYYAVTDETVQNAVEINGLNFDRKVILEQEKNNGAWQDIAKISYSVGDEHNYDVVLSEFLAEHDEFTAELIYDYDRSFYKAVVTGPYSYYRYDDLTVVPDDEANKLTAVFVSDSLTYIASDAEPVAGVHFRLTAVYGYGYKSVEVEDYSTVSIRRDGDFGDTVKYVISYEGFTVDVDYVIIYEAYVDAMRNMVLEYERNCSVDEVILYGEMELYVNGENYGTVNLSFGKNVAELNAALQIYGLSLSLTGFDPTLSCYEQNEVKIVIGNTEGYPEGVFEKGKAFITGTNFYAAKYTQNGDIGQTVLSVEISYSYLDDVGNICEGYYKRTEDTAVTLEQLNYDFEVYGISFEIIGLDTSLPADGQTVSLKCGGYVSDAVAPETV